MKAYLIILCLTACGALVRAQQANVGSLPDVPAELYVTNYTLGESDTEDWYFQAINPATGESQDMVEINGDTVSWTIGVPGEEHWSSSELGGVWLNEYWPVGSYPEQTGVAENSDDDDPGHTNYDETIDAPVIWEHSKLSVSHAWISYWPGYFDFDPAYTNADAEINNTFTGQRTADAVIKLKTGGRPGSKRQNLFCLHATATQYLDDGMSFPWESGATAVAIDPTSITVAGQTLGSDGNAWTTLPDGQDIPITPQVKKVDYYTFGVDQQKYKLYVQANTHILWPDHVNPLAKFCVGQNINFTTDWNPPLPGGTVESPVKWTLGGTYVNTNVPSQYSDGCQDYYIKNTDFLQCETTHAWWIDGKYDPVQLTAAFGEGLTFANGQYLAVASHGLFTMHRPRLVNFSFYPAPCNPNLNSGDLEHNHSSNYDRLAYGGPLGYVDAANNIYELNDNQRGYQPAYKMDVDCSTNFNGNAYITQLVNGYETNSLGGIDTHGTNELDNNEIYNNPYPAAVIVTGGSPTNEVALKDMPGLQCNLHTAQNLHFTDYIRFQPAGGIYVTLGTLTWYVTDSSDFDAVNNDFTPILPPSVTTFPYVMTTGIGHTDTSPTDSNTFPYWDHTATNSQ